MKNTFFLVVMGLSVLAMGTGCGTSACDDYREACLACNSEAECDFAVEFADALGGDDACEAAIDDACSGN